MDSYYAQSAEWKHHGLILAYLSLNSFYIMPEINPIAQAQIDKIAEDCKRIKPLVAIQCITYNHEPYIRDALEGFVMQKTDFPFVAIVHDDASTDGTAAIIREYAEKYPDIIKPIYESENQYSKGSLGQIMRKALCLTEVKYLAFCEGDDYWIAPLKLKKQVDFLESHPDYGMCYMRVKRYNQSKSKFIDEWGGPYESFQDLLTANTIPTLTALVKNNLIKTYIDEINPNGHKWLMGDYPQWLYIAAKSKIKFMPKNIGTYRILRSSASHSTSLIKKIEFLINYRMIAAYYAQKYNQKLTTIINQDQNFWKYTYNIISGERVKFIEKIKYYNSEIKFKRKCLILVSMVSKKAFKSILSYKLLT